MRESAAVSQFEDEFLRASNGLTVGAIALPRQTEYSSSYTSAVHPLMAKESFFDNDFDPC
jgi:hypothetical protein